MLKPSLALAESRIGRFSKKILAKEWGISRHCSNIGVSLDDPDDISNHRLLRISFPEGLELCVIGTVPNFDYMVIVDPDGLLIDFEGPEFPG